MPENRTAKKTYPDDLALDCQLLEQSGLFRTDAYRTATNATDPARHYLLHGWQAGIEPETNFDGRWLYPFFASAGLHDAPALTHATLGAAGYQVFRNRTEAERVAEVIRASGLFDAGAYAARVPDIGDLDPALHYVIAGEMMGLAPSDRFDPTYYGARYPDVRGTSECLLAHYLRTGRAEGRRPLSIASELTYDRRRIDPQRETVLVVSHDATRTGAPILAYNIAKRLHAKYNVVTLLLSGSDLLAAFKDVSDAVVGPLRRKDWHPVEARYLVRHLIDAYRMSYAIANSIDSRIVLKPLSCAFVPAIALVHEFASYLTPKGEMGRELSWATQIVFSAERVAASVRAEHPNIDNYRVHILPQGPCELPGAVDAQERESQGQLIRAAMRPPGRENALVVFGCGTIYPRKGVDLFVACAAAVAERTPKRPIRFVWIGQRLPEELDQGYFAQLREQISKSGIEDSVTILEEVADLEPAYASADIFFLSSRLDPLPNVTIDSALRGLPIVCFADCSGISDILATDPTARQGVVPHLDINAAADVILRLAGDETERRNLGGASRRIAETEFDMEQYVARLDGLGREGVGMMRQRREDYATIDRDEMFDMVGYLGPDADVFSRDDAIRLFLTQAAMMGTGKQPTANFYYRRPCPGFHPQIYADENKSRYDTAVVNPLAHFIRSGKPAGPWSHAVITPARENVPAAGESKLRTAMHVHFFYPELCAELLEMMAPNRSRCDLLLTVGSNGKAKRLRRELAEYDRGDVRIWVVPNRGRDIGAFLTGLGASVIQEYDVIGHLHSKRSRFLFDRLIGERWRNFIWQNLLGAQYPMMDIILDRLASDEGLGLVFPDDPHLSDWDYNRGIAEKLAQQMSLRGTLPPFFDFPIGTMFWARTAALAPLLKLQLDWNSYPNEPAPIDGTILHALERILPFIAQDSGYRYATTHVPGVTW